jgi:hypothetical protein
LEGRPIGELCAEQEISQAQYYQWRDLFLANAAKAFEPTGAHNARAGSNARTCGSRPWSASSPWNSKKRRGARLMRAPYAKVAARNAALLERVPELKSEHPFWGYRRVRAYLRYVDGLVVNQRRVYGTMKANELLVTPNLQASRSTQGRHDRAQADPAQRMVGHRHDQGHDRRLRLGLPRGGTRLGTARRWSATTPACRPAPGTGWWL